MPQPNVQVLEAHRQHAWRLLHQPCWPATLEETLSDPIRARLIETYARQCARAEARVLAHTPSHPPRHSRATHAPTPVPCITDMKRAAAGDRDD